MAQRARHVRREAAREPERPGEVGVVVLEAEAHRALELHLGHRAIASADVPHHDLAAASRARDRARIELAERAELRRPRVRDVDARHAVREPLVQRVLVHAHPRDATEARVTR